MASKKVNSVSLFKQLLVLISLLFLLIFGANYTSGIRHIQEYLQIESKIHVQDTATALGLSLKPYLLQEDEAMVTTVLNSIFDRGYYQSITLLDAEGQTILERTNPNRIEGIPDWFVQILSMDPVTAETEINSNWTLHGLIRVTGNPGVAYSKLYQLAKVSALLSLFLFFTSMGLLFLVLQWALNPLKSIKYVAMAMTEGRFEKIEPLPSTTEIRTVATAMNLMSDKVSRHIAQLRKYGEDLAIVLQSEKEKRFELQATNNQLVKYAKDLQETMRYLKEIKANETLSGEHNEPENPA